MEDDLDDAQSAAAVRARWLGDRARRGRCRRGRHTSDVRERVTRRSVLDQAERPRSVDVADLERDAFGELETEGVEGPEAGAAGNASDRRDDAMDLVDGEDVRERGL